VLAYPIKLGPGDAIDLPIRFAPLSLGPKAGTITIVSNDPASPHILRVRGDAPAPRLSLAIANGGNFGQVCVGRSADEPLVLNSNGHCPVEVFSVVSSTGGFLVPEVLAFPLLIASGASLALPIRFAPTGIGPVAGTITVTSSDPGSPHIIAVSGDAPAGAASDAAASRPGTARRTIAAPTRMRRDDTYDVLAESYSIPDDVQLTGRRVQQRLWLTGAARCEAWCQGRIVAVIDRDPAHALGTGAVRGRGAK
jgi:hypothetical protein